MKKELLIIIIFGALILPIVSAADYNQVIANSEDWTDVYSALHFANLQGITNDFLVSTSHGDLLLNEIPKTKDILVLSSKDRPYVFNYAQSIKQKDYHSAEEIVSDNLNVELAKELPDIQNFIIVSDSFGYNALALAPYAVKTNSWVFLANKENVFEIDSILSQRNINDIIIYGFVDNAISEVLSKYNPEVINNGDRFQDNIEIVKKYLEKFPTTQVALTNGEFIEKELMSGTEPILFTGKQNVPPQISDYLRNSDIKIGVLIGNDLVGAAQNIKESTGIYVMVKFARSARAPAGGISAVEGLDLFPVPTPNLQLSLHSAKYNQALSKLEITYKSNSNIPIYFKGTITLIVDGETKKVGDYDTVFIAPGDYKTISYEIDLNSAKNITGEIYTAFGESPSALEKAITGPINIETVNVIDSCKLDVDDIKSVKYSKQNEEIIVKITNPHEIDCWVDLEIIDLLVGNSRQTIGLEGSERLTPKKTKKISIKQELTESDLEQNQYVTISLLSGEKEDSLVHAIQGKYELQIESLAILTYVIIGLIILIVGLIIFIIILKRRKDDDNDYY